MWGLHLCCSCNVKNIRNSSLQSGTPGACELCCVQMHEAGYLCQVSHAAERERLIMKAHPTQSLHTMGIPKTLCSPNWYTVSYLGRSQIESRCCMQILAWDNRSCWPGSCITPYFLFVKANLCLASLGQTQAEKLCLSTLSTCVYIHPSINMRKNKNVLPCYSKMHL